MVREGPSKKRPIIIDAAVGILGLLLLVGSVALVDILPEDPVVVPQYKAAFEGNIGNPNNSITDLDTGSPVAAQTKFGTEGGDVVWRLDFQETNIYEVTVDLFLADDHPATLPDRFSVFLTSPNGTEFEYQATKGYIETLATIPNPEEIQDRTSPAPAFYVTDPDGEQISLVFRLGAKPSDYFFTTEDIFGEPGDFELFEIQAALEAQETRLETVGEWQIRVEVLESGDCPELDAAGLDVTQANECRIQTAYEQNAGDATAVDPTRDTAIDPGNPVRLSKVTYLRFDIEAQEA